MTVNEKGYAKLNYSLDVHARRPDGYHDLTMVMGSVSLWDDVEVSLRSDGRIEAKCSIPWLPRDERNLAVRAARVFFDAAGDKTLGADIRIKKRVPVGAGMAGGSTDAAHAVVTIEEGCIWEVTGDCTITSLSNAGTIHLNGHTITLADGTVLR